MDIKRTYVVSTILTAQKVCQLLTTGKVNDLPIASGKSVGIAQNNTGTVILKGLSKGHTGLTAGSNYYYDVNGLISINNTGTFVGVALSSTEIYIPDYIID